MVQNWLSLALKCPILTINESTEVQNAQRRICIATELVVGNSRGMNKLQIYVL